MNEEGTPHLLTCTAGSYNLNSILSLKKCRCMQ